MGLDTVQLDALLLAAEVDDSVDASDNEVAEWPRQLRRHAASLVFLSLASNRLSAGPGSDEDEEGPVFSPCLEYLYLFGNRLTECGFACATSMPNLSHLSLHSNPIGSLPVFFPPLLRYLNLSSCQLAGGCPDSVFSLPLLEVLFLNDNALTSVDGLEKLDKLTSLELQRNHIEKLPTLLALTNLQILNATNEPHIQFRSNDKTAIRKWIEAQK